MSREQVEVRILDSALELLRSRGPAAVSIEQVAAHSGIAKTTIYRRFDNRESLLTAAVTSASRPVAIPGDLAARDIVRWVLAHARGTIEHVVGRGTLAAVVGDADPQFRRILLTMIRASIGPFREQLRRGVESGELRADLDVELVISVLTGTVIAEIIRGRPTDDAWADALVDLLWPVLAGPGGREVRPDRT